MWPLYAAIIFGGSMPWGSILGAIAAPVVGSLLGGGRNGGSGGGNAPPVYQPQNQLGMDNAWNSAYGSYHDNVANNNNMTAGLNGQLMQAQYNNPYSNMMMQGADYAGQQYTNTANQSGAASNALFQSGQQVGNAQTQANQLYQNGIADAANSSSRMYGQADLSNQVYAGLMQGINAQGANIQQAQNGLYGAGQNALGETQRLLDYQHGQQGNVQGSANNLYGAGNQILNTGFDPQQALYNQQFGQNVDQTRAAEYARGIQSSPYGAAIENNANQNFNTNWQNQQLGRQSQALQSAQGAYGNAQGMNNAYTQNLSGLQAQGYNTAANASQAAQGIGNSYANTQAGLMGQMNNQYAGMNAAAGSQLQNALQGQSNTNATYAGSTAGLYGAGSNLGSASAGQYGAGGASQYNGANTIFGSQNQALQNFNSNNNPYLTGLGNEMTQAQNYMTGANQAQGQAFNQNNINQQNQNQAIGQIAGPIGNALANTNWNNVGNTVSGWFGGQDNSQWNAWNAAQASSVGG